MLCKEVFYNVYPHCLSDKLKNDDRLEEMLLCFRAGSVETQFRASA
jgi:hypothetical protein